MKRIMRIINSMNEIELQLRINSRTVNEKADASLIAAMAIIFSISAYVLADLELAIIGHFAFGIGLIINLIAFLTIYVLKINYFRNGNSYIKRKFLTIGTLYMIYCLIIPLIMHNHKVDLMVMLVIPLAFHKQIINLLWYRFDQRFYQQVDEDLFLQKRWLFEPEDNPEFIYLAETELHHREQGKSGHRYSNLDDIELIHR